jgi:hypothetical protein
MRRVEEESEQKTKKVNIWNTTWHTQSSTDLADYYRLSKGPNTLDLGPATIINRRPPMYSCSFLRESLGSSAIYRSPCLDAQANASWVDGCVAGARISAEPFSTSA